MVCNPKISFEITVTSQNTKHKTNEDDVGLKNK